MHTHTHTFTLLLLLNHAQAGRQDLGERLFAQRTPRRSAVVLTLHHCRQRTRNPHVSKLFKEKNCPATSICLCISSHLIPHSLAPQQPLLLHSALSSPCLSRFESKKCERQWPIRRVLSRLPSVFLAQIALHRNHHLFNRVSMHAWTFGCTRHTWL